MSYSEWEASFLGFASKDHEQGARLWNLTHETRIPGATQDVMDSIEAEYLALKANGTPPQDAAEEQVYQDWLEQEANPKFEMLVKEGVVPRGLLQCNLPVDSKLSVKERLVILDAPTAPGDPRTPKLNTQYASLAQAIVNLHLGRENIWEDIAAIGKPTAQPDDLAQRISAVEKQIEEAAERGDENTLAVLRVKAGGLYLSQENLRYAEMLYQSALSHFVKTDNFALNAIAKTPESISKLHSKWRGRPETMISLPVPKKLCANSKRSPLLNAKTRRSGFLGRKRAPIMP